MALHEDIETLASKFALLPNSDQAFAHGLVKYYKEHQTLSPKQIPWVEKLIAKADLMAIVKADPLVAPHLAEPLALNVTGIVALFTKAKEHLKFPKIVLKSDGYTVKLSHAGPKSKYPGAIFVSGEGKFGTYYGRVTPEGVWLPTAAAHILPGLEGLLLKLSKNPSRVAKEHGKLTNNCCFCHKFLTDPRSVAAGFGPICAGHFGLTSEWENAVKKAGFTVVGSEVDTATPIYMSYSTSHNLDYSIGAPTHPNPGVKTSITYSQADVAAGVAIMEDMLAKVCFDCGESGEHTPQQCVVNQIAKHLHPACFLCDVNIGTVEKDGVMVCEPCAAELEM